MLAATAGCELDVERGPDWLLVRITSVDADPADGLSLADRLWEVMERHFVYRMVLEMDQIPVLNSYLIGQLVALRRRSGRASRRDPIVRAVALQSPSLADHPAR